MDNTHFNLKIQKQSKKKIKSYQSELTTTGVVIIPNILSNDTFKKLNKIACEKLYDNNIITGNLTSKGYFNFSQQNYKKIIELIQKVTTIKQDVYLYDDGKLRQYNFIIKYNKKKHQFRWHTDPNTSKGVLIPTVITLESDPIFNFKYIYKNKVYIKKMLKNSLLIHDPSIVHKVYNPEDITPIRYVLPIFLTTSNEYYNETFCTMLIKYIPKIKLSELWTVIRNY